MNDGKSFFGVNRRALKITPKTPCQAVFEALTSQQTEHTGPLSHFLGGEYPTTSYCVNLTLSPYLRTNGTEAPIGLRRSGGK